MPRLTIPETGASNLGRGKTNYAVYLEWEKLLRDGYPIYLSDNDVIQTWGYGGVVSTEYLFKVVAIRDGQEWINPFYSHGITRPLTLHDLNHNLLQGAA